jgi:uncharacterized caspase-like protein
MYENGRGVNQDYAEALKWYRKAADQGYADGQYALGFMYENGRGVTQDYAEALKWYRKAADQGNNDARLAVNRVNSRIEQASSPPPTPQINEQRVALIIGNSRYLHIANLTDPENDARLIARNLKQDQFRLTANKVFIDLDKNAFEHALQEFGDQVLGATAKGPAVALFYYAGHGLEVNGVNYLVPISADPLKEADISLQAVSLDAVFDQMDSGRARLKIVILDACRNNPFSGRGLRSVGGGLAQMDAPEGTLIAYSTKPGRVAIDSVGADSPYAMALTHAIQEAGRGLFDVFNDTAVMVKHTTHDAQTPWTNQSAIEGSFYFMQPPS